MANLPPLVVLRRFGMWLLICTVSAAPSFALATQMKADCSGMLVAVLLFALAYGTISCTEWFEHVHRRPFVRSTMYVGYGLRLLLSLAAAFAVVAVVPPFVFALVPDMYCGIVSVRLAAFICAANRPDVTGTFAGAFATTCVQGAILNVVVFVVMLVAYGLQRLFRQRPAEAAPRGFDVVAAQAATPVGPISLPRPIDDEPATADDARQRHERDR